MSYLNFFNWIGLIIGEKTWDAHNFFFFYLKTKECTVMSHINNIWT